MAAPTTAGQFVKLTWHEQVMRIRTYTNPDPAFVQMATCEWFTQQGVFQSAKFPVSELEVTESPTTLPK